MAQHSNYAKDRDLMMEAYASVEGEVPKTSSSAMPRMLNESSCNSEHEEHRHEDAEGHHHSGSDDGECDECGGDGCDVCNGTGENEEGGEHSPITDCTDAIDKLAEMLKGDDKVAVFEDLRDYLAAKLGHEDGEHAEEELKPVGSGKKSYEHLGYGKAEDGE